MAKTEDEVRPPRTNWGGWILILIGCAFLIQNFTGIDFGKLWPLILIAIGIGILMK